jgi:hypothetical protein
LFHENDDPEIIYMLSDGTLQFTKEFFILRSEDKDTVHYERFAFKNNPIKTQLGFNGLEPLDHEEDAGMKVLKQNQNGRVAVGGSIKPNVTKKVMNVSKVNPFEIVGAEEVMFGATKRFVSAMCYSHKCTVWKLLK